LLDRAEIVGLCRRTRIFLPSSKVPLTGDWPFSMRDSIGVPDRVKIKLMKEWQRISEKRLQWEKTRAQVRDNTFGDRDSQNTSLS
jgi:hypothetical protein